MPRLTIDGIEVEVPEGANVLEAARVIGITIPHFCYHPALGSVGACRLCAMKFVEGPVKGVQMSCMVKAADGMVVSTTDGEAARLRSLVIEWLMVNHPHDCPVCDEGGMCLLQDYTVAGGHGTRRYGGKKRTFPDQYLGEFIVHEMNRCIQCYRCARFYQDYAGGTDFGPMQIANKVYFGRHKDGWLESEFSGNLVDVCPTGVFTDRTFRFKSRLWDLEAAPSVCPHCSLGCNTVPGARYRELLRVTARENAEVNGWFICDRGRFGYGFTSRENRPRYPLVRGERAGYGEALSAAADLLFRATGPRGGSAAAFLGSGRASVETNFALGMLASTLGSNNVCYSADPERDVKDRLAAGLMDGCPGVSLTGVGECARIVAAGVDPINEAPMLALMMRQAARKGAQITVIDPREIRLPFAFTHVPARPAELFGGLEDALAAWPADGGRLAVIVGTDAADEALITRAAELSRKLAGSGRDCGLMYVMAGPDSFGAALLAGDGPDFGGVLDGIEKGRIKALVVAESDPLASYPDKDRLDAAIKKLDALVVMDYLPGGLAGSAHVYLPVNATAETDGVFVNSEGRAQAFSRVYRSGVPVNRMGPKPHPPREFHREIPGGARDAWMLLMELAGMLSPDAPRYDDVAGLRKAMAGREPAFAPLVGLDPEGPGVLLGGGRSQVQGRAEPGAAPAGAGLFLLAAHLSFGTEELSSHSDKIMLKAPKPYVMVSASEAGRLGAVNNSTVNVRSGGMSFACTLKTSEKMSDGVAVTPRLSGWDLARQSGKHVTIEKA